MNKYFNGYAQKIEIIYQTDGGFGKFQFLGGVLIGFTKIPFCGNWWVNQVCAPLISIDGFC